MDGLEILERRRKACERCKGVLRKAAVIAVYDYQGNAVRIRKDDLVRALPVDIEDEYLFDKVVAEISDCIERRKEVLDELGR